MRIAVLRAERDGDEGRWPYVFAHGHRTATAEFVHNPTEGKFDGIVVIQSTRPLTRTYDLVCPSTRTLCVLIEPPDIITLPDDYTQQFFTVIGPDRRIVCQNPLLAAAGHHWFVSLTADETIATPFKNKRKLISAVVSGKTDTAGHRIRFALMKHLKDHFGSDLDWFGHGVREIDSKLDALRDYKYHIVLENGCWPHYWSEKLLDAYMANAFPFYWGAPNIEDYFDRNSYCTIDPADHRSTIRKIEQTIRSNAWENSQDKLAEARRKTTGEYHPYSIWESALASVPMSEPKRQIIKPFSEFGFSLRQRTKFRMRNLASRLSRSA